MHSWPPEEKGSESKVGGSCAACPLGGMGGRPCVCRRVCHAFTHSPGAAGSISGRVGIERRQDSWSRCDPRQGQALAAGPGQGRAGGGEGWAPGASGSGGSSRPGGTSSSRPGALAANTRDPFQRGLASLTSGSCPPRRTSGNGVSRRSFPHIPSGSQNSFPIRLSDQVQRVLCARSPVG